MVRVLVFDPKIAGISGDMILGSLISLGANQSLLEKLAKVIENEIDYVEKAELEIVEVLRCEINATLVKLKLKEKIEAKHMDANKLKNYIVRVSEKLRLSDYLKNKAIEVLDLLAKAEATIHKSSKVHFHELASADTIFDIIGALMLLDNLGYMNNSCRIYSLPIATGIGEIKIKHGLLSAPAPATLELIRMKNIPFKVKNVNYELATPTGVAILASITHEFTSNLPVMRINRIGYGAGSRDLKEIPNVLRVFAGEIVEDKGEMEVISIIETNVDHVTGEQIGYLINKLMENGALDVQVIPSIGKKNRPFYIIRVLSRLENRERLAEMLMIETGSLGVRLINIPRIIAKRSTSIVEVNVMGRKFRIRIKKAWLRNGRLISIKPEYEDLKKISIDTNLPLRDVEQIVMKQLSKSRN